MTDDVERRLEAMGIAVSLMCVQLEWLLEKWEEEREEERS